MNAAVGRFDRSEGFAREQLSVMDVVITALEFIFACETVYGKTVFAPRHGAYKFLVLLAMADFVVAYEIRPALAF